MLLFQSTSYSSSDFLNHMNIHFVGSVLVHIETIKKLPGSYSELFNYNKWK